MRLGEIPKEPFKTEVYYVERLTAGTSVQWFIGRHDSLTPVKGKLQMSKTTETTGMVNCYTCGTCNHIAFYLLLGSGTTPFMLQCSRCKDKWQTMTAAQRAEIMKERNILRQEMYGFMQSSCYNLHLRGKMKIERCFYQPDPKQFHKLCSVEPDWRQYILRGGLVPGTLEEGLRHNVIVNWEGIDSLEKCLDFTSKFYGVELTKEDY